MSFTTPISGIQTEPECKVCQNVMFFSIAGAGSRFGTVVAYISA